MPSGLMPASVSRGQLPGFLRDPRARPVVSRVSRSFTWFEIRVHRAGRQTLGGRIGDAPVLLLHTTGRRTGRLRVTPVLFHGESGGTLLLIAANGTAGWNPDWYHNLLGGPDAEVEIDGVRTPVVAVPLDETERVEVWDEATRAFPTLAAAQAATDRQIPLVRLHAADRLRLRQGVRAVIVDDEGRTLLVRFEFPPHLTEEVLWATPGGGVEAGESDRDALTRELAEEVGLRDPSIGPLVWTRTHILPMSTGHDGQRENFYLIRTPHFDPQPVLSEAELRAENVTELRWWSPEDLRSSTEIFAPRRLPELIDSLVEDGPPERPINTAV